MFSRRTLLKSGAASLATSTLGTRAFAATEMPGITDTEIRIGQTCAYSGPASAYGSVGRAEAAYFRMINDLGGINGRKLTLISLDDGYSPPRTVEQTRRLVEQDKVAFIFQGLGTPTSSAVRQYLNDNKVPQVFVSSGADKWADPRHFPWTIGYNPSYRTEAHIYAKTVLSNTPNARIGVLYQNDDLGKDYLTGLKEGLGDKASSMIVKAISYEVTEPTIDSQIISLQGSGADTFFNYATPKFAAQAIRKAHDSGWKPTQYLANVSISIGAVMKPAGLEKGKGIISSLFGKDPTDPHWKGDPGVERWFAFMAKYMPSANLADTFQAYGYGAAQVMVQVLKQCGNDLSRENIMRQAANLKHLEFDMLLPGITVNTAPDDFRPIKQMQLARFNGKTWELFGHVVTG